MYPKETIYRQTISKLFFDQSIMFAKEGDNITHMFYEHILLGHHQSIPYI